MSGPTTGPMTGLARASLRHRAPAFTATFLAVLLGTAMIGSFATLVETAVHVDAVGKVASADQETLITLGAVVGGWGALIVLFSVASTLGITVRQREIELGLLRAIGATPRQARRMVRLEALAVSFAAAACGGLVAAFTGRALLSMLREGGLLSPGVEYAGGPVSLAIAATGVVLTSSIAAAIAARRATRGPVTVVLREAAGDDGRMRWYRVLAGVVLIGYGLVMAVVTVAITADSEDPYAAMSTSGSSSILVGLGLALFAPVLLRRLGGPARMLMGRGASGHLASYNTVRRSHLLAGVLAPVIVLTSAAVGTLMLVSIDGRTLTKTAETAAVGDTINLLNNVVVGMLSLFAAIMVINAFVAVIGNRRAEFERLWLVGASPTQVERSVLAEAGIVAAVGVVIGVVASLATIVPFAVARHEGLVPDGQLWLAPVVVAAVTLLTTGAARGAVRPAVAHAVRGGA